MAAGNAERDTLIANLETMGKIRNGDLLVEADERGLLRRKTNFLTQWKESEKIGTENLFVQITVALDSAAKRIDDGDTELSKRFTAACNGLDTLMSTYRSKGSKGTKAVDCLMAVLTPFHSRLHAEQALDNSVTDLKTLAEKAVKFLANARIASTNSTFSASYFGKDQDDWLLWLLVRAATVHGCADKHKDLRKKVKELVRDATQSRDQKRQHLETWLRDNFDNDGTRRRSINTFMREFWVDQVGPTMIPGKGPLGVDWKLWSEDLDDDLESRETYRIRLVRKAMKCRLGNCGEKACIVATHIVEATHGKLGIGVATIKNYDHVVTLISHQKNELERGLESLKHSGSREALPRDTMVVDGWTSDYWGLRDWFNKLCNPNQMAVRLKTRYNIFNYGITDFFPVKWPPSGDNAGFQLRFATLSKSVFAHQQIRAVLQDSFPDVASFLNKPTRLTAPESPADDDIADLWQKRYDSFDQSLID